MNKKKNIEVDYEIISFPNYNIKKKKSKCKKSNTIESDYYIFIDDYKPNKPLVFLESIDETIYRVDLNHYLQDILNSYSNDPKKILLQFYNDYNRNLIYINNKKVPTADAFLYFIEYKFPNELNNIKMIFTQASMGLPFEMIQSSLKENIYLGELCKNTKSYPMKLNLKIIDDNTFKIKISKKLRIFGLDNSSEAKTFHKINIKLNINLSDEYLIVKIIKI